MKTRKGAVTLLVLVLLGMVIVNGCALVTVETPVPTPDIAAIVETAVATAVASQPTPNTTATYAAIATEVAVTQAAQEPVSTPTPVPPTATPEPTDTPTVGPTGTLTSTDISIAAPELTTQAKSTVTPTPVPPAATPKPTDTPVPPPPPPTATPTNTPTPMPTLCVIGESRICCTDNGGGETEIIPVEPPRTVARIRIDLKKKATKYGFSLREVEAYGPDTGDTNLAIGATPTASSTQDDEACPECFAARKAVDGDINTRWSSDWLDRQSFEITLPDPQVVNRIVLIWETAYAREYCVTVIEP